ncbi:LuxR C-terminal-related transcriptional regulator [Lentzea sp. NPDC059081]|uniref:helix-turn-helix transcriptional regulator n=1 Tax=Lentzea sp. NPDC059081 TaxID=3346719 RepID=UPI0036B73B6D
MLQRLELVGRSAQLDALRWDGHSPALRVVRGASGSGRSAVLGQLARNLAESGTVVLQVRCDDDSRPVWDAYRITTVMDAVRSNLDAFGNDATIIDSLDSLRRVCTPGAYASSWRRHVMLSSLSSLFALIRRRGAVALLVDDADRMDHPVIGLAPVVGAGHLVVASCADSGSVSAADLCSRVDQVVDLPPMSDDEIEAVLGQAAGAPADLSVRRRLRDALGSLCGNPGTVVAVLGDLRRRRRLVQVRGQLVLRDLLEPVALPAEHELCNLVELFAEAGRDLVLLAAAEVGFCLDDLPAIAECTGRSVVAYGHAMDVLVLAGALSCDPAGLVTCPVPALVAAVAEKTGADHILLLHRSMAEQLLEDEWRTPHWSRAVAGHVAAAGRAMRARPDLVPLLLEEAARNAATEHARLAIRRAAWWHAGRGPAEVRLRQEICGSLVRVGDHRQLAAFVDEVVAEGGSFEQDEAVELMRLAALAHVHTGQSVPTRLRTALVETGAAPASLAFADRWFAGHDADPVDVALSFAPAGDRDSGGIAPQTTWTANASTADDMRAACAQRDLVPALRAALGGEYAVPGEGPVALYHRVLNGYDRGDWERALSAARQLELVESGADSVMMCGARLLAAEMCGWKGADRQARSWVEAVPQDGTRPLFRAWVRVGLLDHTGDDEEAWQVGWSAYERWAGDEAATEVDAARLLRRLATLSVGTGGTREGRDVLAEAARRYTAHRSTELLTALHFIRGLLERSVPSAQAAEQMIRGRGSRVELALACQVMARATGEPRPWLDEAYEIAELIGATRLSAMTRRVMGDNGMVVPARRASRSHLSDTELQMVDLVRAGRTNRQIASELRISVKTVEKHLTKLFAKAGCRTRYGLVASSLAGGPGFGEQ